MCFKDVSTKNLRFTEANNADVCLSKYMANMHVAEYFYGKGKFVPVLN